VTSATARCPICGEQGPVAPGPARQQQVGTVAGLLEQVPEVRCPAGHVGSATADPATTRAVLARVRDAVGHARPTRLRGERCAACGARLTMPVRRTPWPVTVDELPGLPVLTFRLDLPSTRCPDCGVDQLPARSQADLAATVTALCVGTHAPSGPPTTSG
jgi:DNA-directed RNA polymerase subunit RPC12/RpoP